MNLKEFISHCHVEVLRSRNGLLLLRLCRCLWSQDMSRQVALRIRLAQMLRHYGLKRLSQRQLFKLATRFGVYLGNRTHIGLGVRFPHPTSVVVGAGLRIGEKCRIYQQVTLAAAPEHWQELMPRLGDNVTVYPGAKFVGEGRVGNNVVVGANAVVNRVFGDNVVLAGVPARVVGHLEPITRTNKIVT